MMQRRLMVSLLAIVMSTISMPGFAFFTSTPVDNLIKIGTDRFSEVYFDGTDTYHMYFETNAQKGEMMPGFFGMPAQYEPPADKFRYATGEIYLNPEVEYVSSEARYVQDSGTKTPVTNVTYDATDHKITWVMDFGLEYRDTFLFSGGMFETPLWPTNVLKLSFKLKDGMYGNIAPVHKASYKHRILGPDGEEGSEVAYFLRGVTKSRDETPTLIKEYFSDEAMTQAITAPVMANSTVYVRYTLNNTTTSNLVLTGVVDGMNLIELNANGAYSSGNVASLLTAAFPIGVPLAAGASHIWTGKATFATTTPTHTQLLGYVDGGSVATNPIPLHSMLSGTNYIAFATGNLYARYKLSLIHI